MHFKFVSPGSLKFIIGSKPFGGNTEGHPQELLTKLDSILGSLPEKLRSALTFVILIR